MASSSDPPTQPSSPPTNADDATSSAISQSCPPKTPQNASLRHQLGTHLAALSDLINSHLVVVRYGAMSSILLLTAYGIANTPLFYRYKSVWDIPERMWKRRWMHGRIVGVASGTERASSMPRHNETHSPSITAPTHEPHRPVIVFFRHSSPMERLFLTQSAMDKAVSSLTGNSTPTRHWIPVELAGIVHPPPHSFETSGLLHKLAQDKARVSIQLLALRATASSLSHKDGPRLPIWDDGQTTAIALMTYRKPHQRFRTTNVSRELVASGQALVSSSVVPRSSDSAEDETTIIHLDPKLKHLREDVAFMSLLERAEYEAWRAKLGVWSSESMRERRMEYQQEEEYLSSRWTTRIWNLWKKGWEWKRRM